MGNYGRDSRDNRGGGGRSFGGRNSGGGSRDFGRGGGGDRQMHSAVCDNCGKDCQVPFRPTSGKPVYCSDCFEKTGGRSDRPERSDRSERPSFRPFPRPDNSQLDAISAKLDEIIKLLKPQTVEKTEVKEEEAKPVVESEEKVEKKKKTSKAKKTSKKKE